ncbi:neural cell adhesion molecule 1-B [Musca domestica]|uniref:Neural cell adhesion molecule 1-B n=2 Tax=Musca domestica TaxID=7370 RepID=A0ABM3VJD7_MUSDO|nr:neural cell adhesion molecule 1-B [Musca domestica]
MKCHKCQRILMACPATTTITCCCCCCSSSSSSATTTQTFTSTSTRTKPTMSCLPANRRAFTSSSLSSAKLSSSSSFSASSMSSFSSSPIFRWIFMTFVFLLPAQNALARLHSSSSLSSASALHSLGLVGSGIGGGGSAGIGGVGGSSSGMGGSLSSKDAHVKTKDIEAVEGKSVSLPCPISAPLDDVYMVLWFRDNAGIPLYSFDVRDKMNTDQARHWSAPEVFGSRAKFHFDSQPATLEIKDIKRHDQGIYRCRIDFRTSQTQSFRFNLSVIILPEQPIILDRWGRQLNGTKLGPKQEGDDIVITCRVVGGRPQPQVRWLVNGLLVDNQYEHYSGDVIENRLLWPSVQRTDLNSVFTCQALNTQLDKPKEKSFILDMHLKPLEVKIIDPPNSMVADRRYEVTCESTGSRPNAIITWYKGKRQLRRTKDDISNNTTRSELSFVPTTDDDGKSITCRAENPNVNGLYLETMWKLNVVYPPLVTLRLGSTLSPDDIKEGDDVYFECHVQSNPQWRKLLWLHNGIHLEHNTSARVIRSNQSLVLQKITKHYAGNYACSAINDEGETVSNQLPLRVKYTPICKHLDRVILIGASKDETVEVACEIQADPPPRSFRWKFNNSGETLDVGSERFSVNGSRSILKYTPVTDQDYGTLSCWASNEVGTQSQPCLFQVVLAALPNAVANCTVFNRTELSVDIQCIPGYDGGLPQIFVLEMFSTRTGITRFNITNPEEPQFSLENLDTLTSIMTQENNSLKLRIYAYNQKGRSPSYLIQDMVIGATGFKNDDDVSLTLSPVIVGSVLTIVIISLAIALKIFMMTFLHNLRRNRQHGTKATATAVVAQTGDVYKGSGMDKPRWQHTDIKSKSSEDLVEDERDPDVIPSQYVGSVGSGSSTSSANASIAGVSVNGVGGGGVNVATNGSVSHHFTSTSSKWSPSSNQHTNKSYESSMMQQNPASAGVAATTATAANAAGGTLGRGGNDSSIPITFNQINARTHLMASASMLSPTGSTTTTATAAGTLSRGGLGVIATSTSASGGDATTVAAYMASDVANIIGSPTSLASSMGSPHMQQKLHSSGVGTLPPGLGSGGGYILNSLINSSSGTAMSSLHHTSASSTSSSSANAGGRVNLHHATTTLHHHNTLGGRGNHGHYMAPTPPSMMLTSQTTSALSGGSGSTPGSTSGVGLLLGSSGVGSTLGGLGVASSSLHSSSLASAAPSTTTTSCNSSTDLDDNINIMAIKDCLMTQRVPESCV